MSFKFPPPPPPPPPKAPSHDSQQSYISQRGGPERGRGGRGRGRGGQGRGGQGHGGEGHGNTHSSRGGIRGGHSHNTRGGASQHQHTPSQANNQPNRNNVVYVNPAFAAQSPAGAQTQPQMDSNAFAQTMSFMSTPIGMQTMAAFANNMVSSVQGNPQYPQSAPTNDAQSAPRYPPGQQAGQKRKRHDQNRNGQPPLPPKKQQSGPKPPRAKAAPPPPVPSFGFSLPQPVATEQPAQSQMGNKKGSAKRKINLGLAQQVGQDEESSSEEDDIDEEAAFALNTKVEGVSFEHNGETISLQTPADIQSYIKDRRRNFPTRQRVAEKAEEAAQKRAAELEFLHRVTGKVPKPKNMARPERQEKLKASKKSSEADANKREELATLRRKHHESMVNKQEASGTVDLGLGYASDTDADDDSSVLSESSVVSSSEESSEDSDSGSDDDGSDAPETQSSKVAPPAINVPPPAPPAQSTRVCHLWGQNGKCRFGESCKYAHPPGRKGKPKEEEKRMGLYEKLVEQELEKSDRLALEAIKYLGQHGFLG